MLSRCERGKYLVPDIRNLSHLATAAVLRQQSAVIPAEKNLNVTSQNINVLRLKSDSPHVSINPSAWRALIGIGAHFPHSNLWLHSDPVFFSFFFFSFLQPCVILTGETLCIQCSGTQRRGRALGNFYFFPLDTDSCCSAQKKLE